MLDMANFEQARCVVELGAGTGVYTEEIGGRGVRGVRGHEHDASARQAVELLAQRPAPSPTEHDALRELLVNERLGERAS
jgi:phospholipid N-methyltransferase